MPKELILLIEDEKNIVELVKYNLEQEGYCVQAVMDGDNGLREAIKGKADLILLDLMLPGIEGLEICKTLKQNAKTSHVPIIILTAKGEETDKVIGLELGADDYVTKPFSPRELSARVKALLRRSKDKFQMGSLKAGVIEVNLQKHQITFKGKPLELTSKEYGLLVALMEAKGKLLSREYLLEKVWGYDPQMRIETRTIDIHIGQLRKKIKTESHRIITVKNAGYRFDHES